MKQQKYNLLKLGEIKARGWMQEQMHLDLNEGLAGAYDKISANVDSNLFALQNRQPGVMVLGNRGRQEKAWWAGEHEGYWQDGILRMAILLEDEGYLNRFEKWLNRVLETADKTGYIGIYDEESRFPDKGFDGELWDQSRVFQALFAWYERTSDKRLLKAMESTVHKTIDHYKKTTYFGRKDVDGGGAHAVGYFDTLEGLFRITGDRYYAEAAIWLYEDYSSHDVFCADMQIDKMIDESELWYEHTPHVAESLHIPGIISFFSNDVRYKKAAANVIKKLKRHTAPGGGFVAGIESKEAIAGAYGAGREANEYCSMTEGIQTLSRLMAYTGELYCGEWSEVCAMNAAQSARFHPANIACAYLSRDNCLSADDPDLFSGRMLFSASHREAACCTLNAIRLLPSYIEGMWYRNDKENEIFVNMYGPCEINTQVKGNNITISEETDFPFSDKVVFKIKAEEPTSFDFVFRIPVNCGTPYVCIENAVISQDDKLIRIKKEWKDGDEIKINFNFKIIQKTQYDKKEAYYQWGVLVFGLPFPTKIEKLLEIENNNGTMSGFYEYTLTPESEEGWDYLINPDATFSIEERTGSNPLQPWIKPSVVLKGSLLTRDKKIKNVELVPIGTCNLKRTTFPFKPYDETKIQEQVDADYMRRF